MLARATRMSALKTCSASILRAPIAPLRATAAVVAPPRVFAASIVAPHRFMCTDGDHARDLKLSGGATTVGGTYGDVLVQGACNFTSSVTAERLKANGALSVDGDVETGALEVNGAFRARGSVTAPAIKVSGSASMDELDANDALFKGSLKVAQGVKCDNLRVNGGVEIGGDLEAQQVSIKAYSANRQIARDIIASRSVAIEAVKADWYVAMFIPFTRDATKVRSITGGKDGTDDLAVELVVVEGLKADVIRGRTVQVKGGCRIGRLEYSDSVEVDEASIVDELVRVSFSDKAARA